jgi:hypothetical protein
MHRSASDIIREQAAREGLATEDHVAKVTLTPDHNQELLLRGVEHLRTIAKVLLLDGHTVLRGPNGTLIDINTDIFRRIRPTAIAHIVDDPAQILARWQARQPTPGLDTVLIFALQVRETTRVEYLQATLGIPTYTLPAGNSAVLSQNFLSLADRLELDCP